MNQVDISSDIIDYVVNVLQIESDRTVLERSGFKWWPGKLAQRIWVEPAANIDRDCGGCLQAESDFLQSVKPSGELFHYLNKLNSESSFSSFSYDDHGRTVRAYCHVVAHSKDSSWLPRVFGSAMALQAAECSRLVTQAGRRLGAPPNYSSHPLSSPQLREHSVLGIIEAIFNPTGVATPPSAEDDLQMLCDLNPAPWTAAVLDPYNLSAQLSWKCTRKNRSSKATISIEFQSPHIALGGGVRIMLNLPCDVSASIAPEIVHQLNREARRDQDCGNKLGAWASGVDGTVSFTTFIPTLSYRWEAFHALVIDMADHADWAVAHIESALAEAGRRAKPNLTSA